MLRRLLFILLLGATARGATAPRALLLYDGKTEARGEGYVSAQYIANLLGHFNVSYEIRSVASYHRGDTEHYSYVFYAGTDLKTRLPRTFLEDVTRTETDVVWIGRQVDQLVGQSATGKNALRFGFRSLGYRESGFEFVTYRNLRIPKGDHELNLVTVLDDKRVRVHSSAVSLSGPVYPYVLQRDNFWFIADSPFSYSNEGDRYLVFCDLLHDILEEAGGTQHQTTHRAMVRIEDVSPDSNPEELKAVADYLRSQRVPFQVALVPVFRDPERGLEIRLSDRPQVAEAVRYMVSRGGTVVMHGVTHQYRGVTGDDYEFWNYLTDKPIANDRAETVESRLELGLRECFSNGIYPLAWETPHNAGSPVDYLTLAKYFTVFHERVLAEATLTSEQYFPYPVHDRYGRFILPENLGYLKLGESNTQPIVDNARSMLAVRDGIAAFYFHPFMKLEYLKQIVGGIRAQGFEFISLREFAPRVRFRNFRAEITDRSSLAPLTAEVAGRSGWVHRVVLSPGGAKLEDVVVPPAAAVAEAPRGALVALEPAAGPPRVEDRSLKARLIRWMRPAVQETATPAPELDTPQAVILWNSAARGPAAIEQQAFENVLSTYGYGTERLEWKKFLRGPSGRLLVVPAAAASQLSAPQQEAVLAWLRDGDALLVAGRSELAVKLGIRFAGRQLPVKVITDLNHPERYLRWAPEEKVELFEPPDGATPLVLDQESRQPLAFGGRFEKGRYLYLAVPLDSVSPLGLTRFPYLAQHLEEVFRFRPRAIRPRLEVYFDPGFRQGLDLGRLVNSWRKSGIRTVHVAAWQFYPRYTFKYRDFIELCHRHGIAAYAWFELPMVTKKFWDEHPEWREKTASGEDAQVGWRYLMNLYNPQARRAALEFVRDLLEGRLSDHQGRPLGDLEWDGMNLAELNFDSVPALMTPAKYVPMNKDVRDEFRRRKGVDPLELFHPQSPYYWERNPGARKAFSDFRVEIVTQLHVDFLDELVKIRKKKDLEIMVTMLDGIHSPRLREHLGIESREIVKLMKRYPFTLQVEDASDFWVASPERYRDFGKDYLKLVSDPARLMFDVNVVEERNVQPTSLPSALATGTEFARLLLSAAAPTGRAAVYSEWTVTPQDWQFSAAVLAAGTKVTRAGGPDSWRIHAPRAVAVRVPPQIGAFYLDGEPWPVFETGAVLVPAGEHVLAFSPPRWRWLGTDLEQLELRLRSISGELVDAGATRRGMFFDYDSPGRCVVVFNKQIHHVTVDGREWQGAPLFSRGEWALVLPSGRHRADVVANEAAVFAVELAGLVSSSLIVVLGKVSCGAMLGFYIFLRLQRGLLFLRRRWTRLRVRFQES